MHFWLSRDHYFTVQIIWRLENILFSVFVSLLSIIDIDSLCVCVYYFSNLTLKLLDLIDFRQFNTRIDLFNHLFTTLSSLFIKCSLCDTCKQFCLHFIRLIWILFRNMKHSVWLLCSLFFVKNVSFSYQFCLHWTEFLL